MSMYSDNSTAATIDTLLSRSATGDLEASFSDSLDLPVDALRSFQSSVDAVELPKLSKSWVILKRATDVVGSVCFIVVLSPAFLLIYGLILRSGGDAIYGHPRLGKGGRWFTCLKFRTMVPDAETILADLLERDPDARAEWARDEKLRDDPRVTPIGAFLRRTSLDELPQLFNVLRGDMSLVGPRPVTSEGASHYGKALRWYLAARPGMTGLWQVSGRNTTGFRRRVVLDMHYVRAQSFLLDVQILLRTVRVVVFGNGY